MPPESSDYRVVRTVAVTAEDVVAAYEATVTGGPPAVVRVTPPFSGRMRGRIHVEQPGEYGDREPRPLHVRPEALIEDDAVPPYPSAVETEDDLRADPDSEYSVEAHYDRHTDAVEAWRAAVREAIADRVAVEGPAGPHRVSVAVLD